MGSKEFVTIGKKKVKLKTRWGKAKLDLHKRDLTSLAAVDGLDALSEVRTLILDDNQFTTLESIRGIPVLAGVQTLSIKDNKLENLAGIESLANLTELDLSGNALQAITELGRNQSLETLDLSGNAITMVGELPVSLRQLNLAGNQLDVAALEPLTQHSLSSLDLSDNPLPAAFFQFTPSQMGIKLKDLLAGWSIREEILEGRRQRLARERAADKAPYGGQITPQDFLTIAGNREERGDWEGALVAVGQAFEANYFAFDSHFLAGRLHLRLGNYQAAIENFAKAVICDPANPAAWQSLGLVLHETISEPESLEIDRKLRKQNKILRKTIKRNDVESLRRAFHVALQFNEDDLTSTAYLTLHNLPLQAEHVEEARQRVERAMKNQSSTNYAAELRAARQAYDKAEAHFKEMTAYLEEVFRVGVAQSNIPVMRLILERALQTNDYQTAMEMVSVLLELEPNDRNHWATVSFLNEKADDAGKMVFSLLRHLELGGRLENAGLIELVGRVAPVALELQAASEQQRTEREAWEADRRIQRIEKILRVSNKLRLSMMRNALELDKEFFDVKVFDWADEFGFTIDGDYLLVNTENVAGFVESLSREFEEWGAREMDKQGKLE